ncbi:Molybdenum cofactor guanylyltransferase [Sporomusa acidovorans DSM 3132]|uniref:Molybdenum cofactor guanylyltransferase n=1 Tax=Sporomusa acidovorans (strain ATCC 49682 / DSM 3132 / Mol) TaxID=1123286 RepID=A0ABZ3J0D0_SPOA4|nr:molybdenum cofactor cytidylyltransferase [Sporomusa acidovorans DSM 3132]SDF35623.1 CTP:molybdopterin cytidylyltransferase MocA [Sporomusa acidovorans]
MAAGYSSRMGAFKPLLPLGEKTVIETAVDSLRLGGAADIRVVVGYRAEDLYSVLGRRKVGIIHNLRYSDGMFSSIVAGVRTLTDGVDAFLLLPVDIPLIRRHSIKELVRVYRETGAAVIYPVFNGQRGHPPLISAKCFASILNADGIGGLRPVLEQFADNSVEVEVADSGILLDMDNRQEYQQLVGFQMRRHIPTYDEGLVLFRKYQVSDSVMRHGQAVAKIGRHIAELLNDAGLQLNTELIFAAGLLHDLAKGKPNHAKRGERVLKTKEFPDLAGIVGSHMNLDFEAGQAVDETAIVFLADKVVHGNKVVPLDARFKPAQEKFADNPAILNIVLQRKRTAEVIWGQIAAILGIRNFELKLTGGEVYEAHLLK